MKSRLWNLWSAIAACMLLMEGAGWAADVPVPALRPPNIVFILADDLGWNQVGYHGSRWYETPHIDRIAREGMWFSDAYAAAPICSPTRAALMTGKAPARLHLTDYIPGKKWEEKPLVTPAMQQGLPLEETTLPEMLHTRGYISGLFGKWHLAPTYDYAPWRPLDPESQGFDVVYHTRKPESENTPAQDCHNAIALTDEAIAFLEHNRNRPFFCYVAHNVVHTPLMEDEPAIEKYRRKPRADQPVNNAVMAAMIETMDQQIGRLMETLERLKLRESTIVVFMSDNGNVMALQSQAPFRGGKATIWEGGLRVPLAVSWPGRIPAGSVSHEPVITHDWFSTLMDISGTPYEPRLHDGVSLWPILSGRSATLGRKALFWHYPHYHHLGDFRPGSVIREGRFKLIEWAEGTLLGKGPEASLFDLDTDPGETTDLAAREPERVKAMRARLAAWLRQVDAQRMSRR